MRGGCELPGRAQARIGPAVSGEKPSRRFRAIKRGRSPATGQGVGIIKRPGQKGHPKWAKNILGLFFNFSLAVFLA